MTGVFLVRHCEAEGNLYRRTHGVYDSDITPRGEKQLEYLAKRFAGESFQAVYSSDLRRARKTAAAIAATKGLSVQVEKGFREQSMGMWEDFSWYEIEAAYPAQFAAWRADPVNFPIPGGEAEVAAGERFCRALLATAERHTGETVVIVAHSMVIRALQIQCLGPEVATWGDNTSVSFLEVEGDAIHFVSCGDVSHLPEELRTMHKQQWWRKGDDLGGYSLRYLPLASVSLAERGALLAGLPGYQPTASCFVGKEGERIVGVIDTEDDRVRQDVTWVRAIFVPECYRGSEFGCQLLGEAIYRAKKRGRFTICLRAPVPFPGMEGFLYKNRFRPRQTADGAFYEKCLTS